MQGLLTAAGADQPWTTFFTRPLSLVLVAASVLALGAPAYRAYRARRAGAGAVDFDQPDYVEFDQPDYVEKED